MNKCFKCNNQFGLFIEDEYGNLCVACHPTAISNMLSPAENFEKIKHLDFPRIKNMKFDEPPSADKTDFDNAVSKTITKYKTVLENLAKR